MKIDPVFDRYEMFEVTERSQSLGPDGYWIFSIRYKKDGRYCQDIISTDPCKADIHYILDENFDPTINMKKFYNECELLPRTYLHGHNYLGYTSVEFMSRKDGINTLLSRSNDPRPGFEDFDEQLSDSEALDLIESLTTNVL